VILLCGPDSVGAAAASELREAVPTVEDAACYSVVCSHRLCWLCLGPRKGLLRSGAGAEPACDDGDGGGRTSAGAVRVGRRRRARTITSMRKELQTLTHCTQQRFLAKAEWRRRLNQCDHC
jgi:hypothetical protein